MQYRRIPTINAWTVNGMHCSQALLGYVVCVMHFIVRWHYTVMLLCILYPASFLIKLTCRELMRWVSGASSRSLTSDGTTSSEVMMYVTWLNNPHFFPSSREDVLYCLDI